MNGLPVGGVPLDNVGRIAVTKHRILIPALVDACAGGLEFDGCDLHLRVVDIPAGVAYYVPMPQRLADSVSKALSYVNHPNHRTDLTEVSSHERH